MLAFKAGMRGPGNQLDVQFGQLKTQHARMSLLMSTAVKLRIPGSQ